MEPTKQLLRARLRRIRAAIPDRARRTAAIWTGVIDECRRVDARTVMGFVGVGSEPDTSDLIEQLVALGIRVVLPRIEAEQIVAVIYDPHGALTVGPYGIPAPAGPAIDPTAIDVVIVPGLAFTADGRRLGQGGGFYDRFLPRLDDDCITIGVAFAEQIVDDLETEPHDRPVDLVITDES